MIVDIDGQGRGRGRQTGRRIMAPAIGNQETRPCRDLEFGTEKSQPLWKPTVQHFVVGSGFLRLGNADRQVPQTQTLEVLISASALPENRTGDPAP